MKNLLKAYVWHEYRSRNKSLSTLCKQVRELKRTLNQYLVINDIEKIKELTVEDAEKYQTFLNLLLNKNGNPYSQSTKATSYAAFRGLIFYGQRHHKDMVPVNDIFIGATPFRRNRKPQIDYMPDEVMEKINAALPNEKNEYLRSAIIIFKYTGMRMGELISLKADCLKEHLVNGYTLQWMDYKNLRERNPVPVHKECAKVIQELLHQTKEIRLKASAPQKEYLFIRETRYGIKRVTSGMINHGLKKFTSEHDIRGKNNEIYHLASHQFRRTLATDMFSNGVNIKILQETLGHTSVLTTSKYYVDVKDKHRIEMFQKIGVIGNIKSIDKSIIEDAGELGWFKENMNAAARMCDGYCTMPFNT